MAGADGKEVKASEIYVMTYHTYIIYYLALWWFVCTNGCSLSLYTYDIIMACINSDLSTIMEIISVDLL